MAFGDHLSASDISLSGIGAVQGICYDGLSTMYVLGDPANGGSDKVFAYTLNSGARNTFKEFNLNSGDDGPNGFFANTTTMWVTRSVAGTNNNNLATWRNQVRGYTLNTGGTRDTGVDFQVGGGNASYNIGVLAYDGTTVWFSRENRKGGIQPNRAYTVSTERRDNTKDGDNFPMSVHSGIKGGTVWMCGSLFADATLANKAVAYSLPGFERDVAKTFTLATANAMCASSIVVGNTMWVLDPDDNIAYAYDVTPGAAPPPASTPALYLGSKAVTGVYVGSKAATAAYLGDTEIWTA